MGAAQKLYEEHKALTYPRTSSRFLTGDLVADIRPTAELVGHNPAYRKGAEYVTGLEELPLGRVVNDKKVEDHHAIIPTKSEHDLGRMGADELKVYDLAAKRFLAVFHPEAVFERTRVETTVAEHVFRTSGRRLVVAGWKAVYGDEVSSEGAPDDDSGGDQSLPKLDQDEAVEIRSVESLRKETQPPRRFTEASLLAAMEGAGKDIEDDELREAMKESGIGTPATRAATIELLLYREYVEREGRALHATEKGIQVIRLLGAHPLTSAELTGDWERRLGLIERGEDPGVGRTAKPVTGFKGRSGRSFRAKLKMEQNEEGKWRVEFDEEWATAPRAQPAEESSDGDGDSAAAGASSDAAPAQANGSEEGQPTPGNGSRRRSKARSAS